MTTLAQPGTYREWQVNRVQTALRRIANDCGKPRIPRSESLALAQALQEVARDVADLYYCPVCQHPEVCACAACPLGSLTARPISA